MSNFFWGGSGWKRRQGARRCAPHAAAFAVGRTSADFADKGCDVLLISLVWLTSAWVWGLLGEGLPAVTAAEVRHLLGNVLSRITQLWEVLKGPPLRVNFENAG